MPFYQFGLNPNQKDDLTEYVLDYMQSTAESVNVGGDLVVKGNIEVDGSVTMPNLQLDLTTDEVEETTTKQYLTNAAQTITGEKTFESLRVENDNNPPTLELHKADGSVLSGDILAELRISAEDNNPKGRTCALIQAKCVNTFPSGLDENGIPNSENATSASTQLDFFCQDNDADDQIANPLLSLVGPGRIVSVDGTFQPSVISASGGITAAGQISSEQNGNLIRIVAGGNSDIAYMDMKVNGGNSTRDVRMSVNSTADANTREQGDVTLKCNSLTIANDSTVDSKTVNNATLNVPRLDVGTAYKFKSEATTFFDSDTDLNSPETIPRYATRVVCSTQGTGTNEYYLRDAAEFISDHGEHSSLIVKRCGGNNVTLKVPSGNNFYGTKDVNNGESTTSTDDFTIDNNTSWVEFWPIPADPNRTTSSFFGGTAKGWLLTAGARLEVITNDNFHP